MEVDEIIENVEESFKDKDCAFVDLLKNKSNNISKSNLDNYMNLIKRTFENRDYSCAIGIERDKDRSYYKLRIKNPSKN